MSMAIRASTSKQRSNGLSLLTPLSPGRLERLLFSLKTFAAAILALLLSYLLEVKDPQWAVVTAYLVSQPMVGAILAKGAYRIIGTVIGAAFAVLCVGLFAQAGPIFILVMAVWLGACAFGATLTRNYRSYSFALAGFSAVMIGFEAVAVPDQVWNLAVDRMTEVGLGIVCVGLVHGMVLPRYASNVLKAALASTFTGLAGYAAVALRAGTPEAVFADLRHRMTADVIKFDALRSYAVFESPELQRDDEPLSRLMRAFLGLLSAARGLHPLLERLRGQRDPTLANLLDRPLSQVADAFADMAADRSGPRSSAIDAALQDAHRLIDETQPRLESQAASRAAEQVGDALLALRHTGNMIESLRRALAAASGTAPSDAIAGPSLIAAIERDPGAALVQAVRAASALLLVGVYWIASAWTAAVPAMTGLAIVIVLFVTAVNPGQLAAKFLVGAALAMVVAVICRVLVVPLLGDFVPFAVLLGLVLIPAGIVMTSPVHGLLATAFATFFAVQVGLTNVPVFDTGSYIDSSIGMLLGIGVGVLAIDLILPDDPGRLRRRAWRQIVAALPAAARRERDERAARWPVLQALLKLMPRLDLGLATDNAILDGTFGAASLSSELVYLRNRASGPDFPVEARATIVACLDRLALGFERLARAGGQQGRSTIVDEAVAAVAAARTSLAGLPTAPGAPESVEMAYALASLRFIAERLRVDRAFLSWTIAESKS
jgi:uncharacterized membrane protein YccC